jgi:hypothetical protein
MGSTAFVGGLWAQFRNWNISNRLIILSSLNKDCRVISELVG